MSFFNFNFWRKQTVAELPVTEPFVEVIDTTRLYCFSCKWCGAELFDGQTNCLVCHTPYPLRVSEVASEHWKAKWKLVKVLEYDALADVLKESTEKIVKNPSLSPKEVFKEMLGFWGAQ